MSCFLASGAGTHTRTQAEMKNSTFLHYCIGSGRVYTVYRYVCVPRTAATGMRTQHRLEIKLGCKAF